MNIQKFHHVIAGVMPFITAHDTLFPFQCLSNAGSRFAKMQHYVSYLFVPKKTHFQQQRIKHFFRIC